MKIINVFKNLRFYTFFIISILIVSSCDNEDDSFNPLLISISVPDQQFDNPVYVMASSPDGTIVTFNELLNGETTRLTSDTFKDNSFVLTVVSIVEYNGLYKELYATSYTGVNRGAEIALSEGNTSSINLNVSNFETNASFYSISSNGDAGYRYLDYGIDNLQISKSPTRLFVTKFNDNGEPVGFLFPTATYASGQTANLNLTANYSNFSSETVNLSEEVYLGTTVYGRPSTSDFTDRYVVSEPYDFSNQLVIKYPGNTFPAYSSESYIEADDYYFTSYNKSSRSDFSLFEASVNLTVNGQTANYSVTSTGKIATLEAFMDEENETEELYWDIYAPVGTNQSFVLPQLPSEISNQFDSYNYNNWLFEEGLGVIVPEGVNTINEYLISETDGSLFTTKNIKYLYLYLDSGSARERRDNSLDKNDKTLNVFNSKAKLKHAMVRSRK